MKTIRLNQDQIDLICQALGIAEKQFVNVFTTIKETTISVRQHTSDEIEKIHLEFYHEMACKMADLNIDLQQGKFDV